MNNIVGVVVDKKGDRLDARYVLFQQTRIAFGEMRKVGWLVGTPLLSTTIWTFWRRNEEFQRKHTKMLQRGTANILMPSWQKFLKRENYLRLDAADRATKSLHKMGQYSIVGCTDVSPSSCIDHFSTKWIILKTV